MNEKLQKQLENEAILESCSIDGKVRIWVDKKDKVNYDELYKIIAQMNRTRQQRLSITT